jgi:LIVCS family branched-chain amino acid:cation transporter
MMAIVAYGRLQGTMYDFGKKVSPVFSMVYCIIIYIIAVALPSPRTAAVTHEMSIQPFFQSSSLLTSTIYFLLVAVFALNRSKVISILGRYLTPIIVLILMIIIGITFFSSHPDILELTFSDPFVSGMLEGYQTYDAIGGVVCGAVLVVSLKIAGELDYDENRALIKTSALITGCGLATIYVGLIVVGSMSSGAFDTGIDRTALLSGISKLTLGNMGNAFLSVLVALACFTTAVGIVTGAGDFFKGILKDSQTAYIITVIIGCILGVAIGQFDVHYIIVVAVPTLMFIYPLTIVLILLNVVPEKYASPVVFRSVVAITILLSIPDFLSALGMADQVQGIIDIIPLGDKSLGWFFPAILTFLIASFLSVRRENHA